jgi:hypothetical protein
MRWCVLRAAFHCGPSVVRPGLHGMGKGQHQASSRGRCPRPERFLVPGGAQAGHRASSACDSASPAGSAARRQSRCAGGCRRPSVLAVVSCHMCARCADGSALDALDGGVSVCSRPSRHAAESAQACTSASMVGVPPPNAPRRATGLAAGDAARGIEHADGGGAPGAAQAGHGVQRALKALVAHGEVLRASVSKLPKGDVQRCMVRPPGMRRAFQTHVTVCARPGPACARRPRRPYRRQSPHKRRAVAMRGAGFQSFLLRTGAGSCHEGLSWQGLSWQWEVAMAKYSNDSTRAGSRRCTVLDQKWW